MEGKKSRFLAGARGFDPDSARHIDTFSYTVRASCAGTLARTADTTSFRKPRKVISTHSCEMSGSLPGSLPLLRSECAVGAFDFIY